MAQRISQKFPKSHRLTRSREFRLLYEQGERINSPNFVLYARQNALPHSRLGITVSRKIGKAVVRNRCKRLVREVFRRNQALFPKGFDMVVNVKRSMVGVSYWDLEEEFLAAIAKLCSRGEGKTDGATGQGP